MKCTDDLFKLGGSSLMGVAGGETGVYYSSPKLGLRKSVEIEG